jgi:putative membrane protein
VLQVLPVESLPRVEPLLALVPHLNAAISVAAVTVIAVGWRAIRRGDVRRHRRAMLSGFLFFGAFLGLYLYKVALTGPTPFDGPGWVAAYVYYPILGVHVLLAMVCVPLLFSVLLLALTRPVAEIPLTEHPRIGRITAALWLSSFVLGTIVYAKLYLIY